MCLGLPIPDLCKIQGLPIDPAANMTPFLHFAEKVSDFLLKNKPTHLLFENNNPYWKYAHVMFHGFMTLEQWDIINSL